MTEHPASHPTTSRASSALAFALAASALLWIPASASAQCSLCRDAVGAASTQTREAMNYAIIGLAMAPYVVASIAAWALSPTLRAFVRLRLRRVAASNASEPV